MQRINLPHITAYSLKRNGVTHRRLRGDSDKEIQSAARWTTTKQLHTYDIAEQKESYKIELIKKGLMPISKEYEYLKNEVEQVKVCPFCNHRNGITETTCSKCT